MLRSQHSETRTAKEQRHEYCPRRHGRGLQPPKERGGQKSERKRENPIRLFRSVKGLSRQLREGRSPLRRGRDGRGSRRQRRRPSCFLWGPQTRLSFRTCYQIQRLVAHKKPAHGPFDNTEYSSSSYTDDYGVSPKLTALFSADWFFQDDRLVHDQAREGGHVRLQVNNHAHQGCQSNAMPENVA